MFTGTGTHRAWVYELALFTAWHVAAFNAQAKVGKLQSWDHYRQKTTGTSTAAPSTDWKTRKAERQKQMQQLKRDREARTRPLRKRG